MGANFTCPQCGKRMTMNFDSGKVFCEQCGYIRPDEISTLGQKRAEVQAQKRQAVPLTYRGELNVRTRSAFETGHDLLARGDTQGAIRAFKSAVDLQPDFTDGHLWIAKIATDEKTQREHVDMALAYDPNNGEAIRMKMVLSGRLTPEQAARTYREDGPEVRQATEPVSAKAAELLCPVCGGHLTVNEGVHQVECRFCGYAAPHEEKGQAGGDLLTMAMLERKAQPVRWNVGQRLVQCQQCGAEHTVPAVKLSARCRFCGSAQVILGDALNSFEQPDGILPFVLSPEQASTHIRKQLDSLGQRIANLFNTNRVQQLSVEGVYVPFWVFDVIVEITHTRTLYGYGIMATPETSKEIDMVPSVHIGAVKSPPPDVTGKIGPYDLSGVVPYAPKWLAKYPAELYSIDFDAASLEAREVVSTAMRRKYARKIENKRIDEHGKEQTEVIQATTRIQNMTFQLLLLPVWVATMTEVDGDMRLALVNGQTGKTAFGRTHRKQN